VRGTHASALLSLEYVTGVTALVGGMLLMAQPNGSLLRANRDALARSPFSDWRVPGLLLAILVGAGFLLAAECQRRRLDHARGLSILAGLGLIAFEIAEFAWIGLQPLEVVFAIVGIAVVVLAARGRVDAAMSTRLKEGGDRDPKARERVNQ
jgi:hypothetical protein